MTDTDLEPDTDVLHAFLNALTPWARRHLHLDPALVAQVHAACRTEAWTPASLAAHVSHLVDHYTYPGMAHSLMAWRIERAAHPDTDEQQEN